MKNISLIGMPGAGKSTLGIVLAKRTGYSFVDTDILVQRNENMLLQQIIDLKGTEYFLNAESRSILSYSFNRCVIATGGSVVLNSRTMEFLRSVSTVVYLSLDLKTVTERINNINSRGIVFTPGRSLADIYNERTPLYKNYADILIDCNNKDFERIIEEILVTIL